MDFFQRLHDYGRGLLAVLCCTALMTVPAFAAVSWKRVGTVTTLTSGQLCKTDGTVIICDTTTPTIVSGMVGIGTTTPTNILSLSGSAAQTFWMERGTAAGNGLTVQAGGGLSGGTNENGGTLVLASGISTGTGSSGLNFNIYKSGSTGTADNSATTAMTITGAGNVGIGTASPLQALDVNGIIAANGSATITSNPPTVGTNQGWKFVMYNANYALGVANNTMATQVNGGWFSIFGGLGNPANNATLTPAVPDTHAVVSFNSGTGSALFNGSIGFNATTSTLPTNGIYSPSTNSVAVTTNGSAAITVNSSQQVGVGTTSVPTGVTAAVNGSIQVAGTGSEACTDAQVGSIRYNPTGKYFELCSFP